MNFIDSSVIIAAAVIGDANHKRAAELLSEASKERCVITDHILGEVATFLRKKLGSEQAYGLSLRLVNNLEVVFFTHKGVLMALEIMKKYRILSLCDALTVVAMRSLNAKRLYSFDSDFDIIEGVERIS